MTETRTPRTAPETGSPFTKRTGSLRPLPAAIAVVAAFVVGGGLVGSIPIWAFLLVAVVVGAGTMYATKRND